MKKRVISKKISGVRKDGTKWFGIVFGADFANGVLYQEKAVFVPENIWKQMKEKDTITLE